MPDDACMYCAESMSASGCFISVRSGEGRSKSKYAIPACKSVDLQPFNINRFKPVAKYPSTNRAFKCEQGCNSYIPSYNYKQHMMKVHLMEESDFETDETLKKEYEFCRWSSEEVKAVTSSYNICRKASQVSPSKRTRDQFDEGQEDNESNSN